jgi:methyl-accepting chemotaxis protein
MLNGHLEIAASEVKDHHACALGQWYDGPDGHRWNHLPAFKQIGITHERFHKQVSDIVTLYNSNKRHEAHGQFINLTTLTDEIFAMLDRLSIEVAKV